MTAMGIIGAGMIAYVHAETIESLGTKILAVYDPAESKAGLGPLGPPSWFRNPVRSTQSGCLKWEW